MREKPFRHFSIPENVQFNMDAADAAASITQKIVVQRVKQIDNALIQGCLEVAKDAGITDLYLIDEDFVLTALKRQIPMEPDSSQAQWHVSHYCPVCGNQLKSPTVEMFTVGSYCDRCGQKIKWGDCHD